MPQPKQKQTRRPGLTKPMKPQPEVMPASYRPAGKLVGKVALITGGDSGIGRSVAVMYAAEGADVAVIYLDEHDDASETKRLVEGFGRKCLLLAGDIGREAFCKRAVAKTIRTFGKLNILVNNAAEQHPQDSILDITEEQLRRTFQTNVFGMFFLVKAALSELRKHSGSTIINTSSVTSYRGSPTLLDYSATKGAITAFTRALSQVLIKEEEGGIRVNGVAPGPIWTPLIPSTFPVEKIKSFGDDQPIGRVGQPWEVATCFVFLASDDSSYLTGQVLHPNGGEVVNT